MTRLRHKLPVVYDEPPAEPSGDGGGQSRRAFLQMFGKVAALGMFAACDEETRERIFRGSFRELSPDEIKRYIARLEREYKDTYGVDVRVGAEPPIEGVVFAYALDLSRCIGCRRCVHACVEENNQSRDPEIQYITVLEMEKRHGVDLERANAYYDPLQVPRPGHFYLPVACQQCDNAPCVRVCPVGAMAWS